ncbi:MAG TPA: DUF2911 domain-containing protein [Candidatus Angelobacter sp.]
MRQRFVAATVFIALVLSTASPAQEDKSKRPSPPGTAEVTLKGKKVTIDYSRPSARGRKVAGGLIPYDKVWRTGANEATTLKTEVALNIGGVKVPAGTYTIYTLASETAPWKLIINKQTGQWGTEYHQEQDLARVEMKVSQTKQPVEQFTISFDKMGEDAATLVLEWENSRASVSLKAE